MERSFHYDSGTFIPIQESSRKYMPRPKSHSRTALVDSALSTFWKTGYHVVSMGDLVRETGVSRGGIYSDFAGKQELFHACLERYQETVVTSNLAAVEAEDAGIEAIGKYLETIISAFEQSDSPCIGCLVVNTFAQLAPDDTETRKLLEAHFKRQENGFRTVIANENRARKNLSKREVDALAKFVTISIHGFVARFRMATDAKPLRQFAQTLMEILVARVHGHS